MLTPSYLWLGTQQPRRQRNAIQQRRRQPRPARSQRPSASFRCGTAWHTGRDRGVRADAEKDNGRDKLRLWLEGVATIALIGTLYLSMASVREARRGSDAAIASANAAVEQARTFQQQVYAGERAYLLIRNVRLVGGNGPLKAGDRLRLQWDVENVGPTPAHGLITTFEFYYGDRAVPPQVDTTRAYSEARILGPHDIEHSPDTGAVWLESKPGRLITPDEERHLRAGEIYLNARIVVTYETVFGIKGHTEICAYYEGSQFSYCGVRGMQIQ